MTLLLLPQRRLADMSANPALIEYGIERVNRGMPCY